MGHTGAGLSADAASAQQLQAGQMNSGSPSSAGTGGSSKSSSGSRWNSETQSDLFRCREWEQPEFRAGLLTAAGERPSMTASAAEEFQPEGSCLLLLLSSPVLSGVFLRGRRKNGNVGFLHSKRKKTLGFKSVEHEH